MMTLIAAALAAAAPAPASPAMPDSHAPMMQMGEKPAAEHAMKEECCCKDMMSKMHEGHGAEHGERTGR